MTQMVFKSIRVINPATNFDEISDVIIKENKIVSILKNINLDILIKKDKSIKKNDNVIITAGLPFGQAKMTNMIRFFKAGS